MRKNLIKIMIFTMFFIFALQNYSHAFWGLPNIDKLERLEMVEATQVFDGDGKLLSKLFEENRTVVSINNIAPDLQNAIVANEDIRFYKHLGVDPIGILRAAFVNLKSGNVVEGGSTITQQLAKNMFLSQEQTFTRKIKEAVLAFLIERKFSKQEILEAYLNQIYFGEGTYGVEAAAQMYFGKRAKELTLAESALLAGLPKGPNLYSPYTNPEAAVTRRGVVLSVLERTGYITREEFELAKNQPLKLAGKRQRIAQASYFLDYIASELVERYGSDVVYKGGLKVYTTLDIKVQQAAEAVLGDRQGAVFAINPKNGYIKAMVGGRNYKESQINRVFAEVRQPGSAFKPFLYAEALNKGYLSNSVIVDEAVNFNGYKPKNYDKKFYGPVTTKKALRLSLNTATVKLGQQVGMGSVLNLAKTMGISTLMPDDNNLAAALGGLTRGVNLYEISIAYTAFANGGVMAMPIAILKVLDENDKVLEETHVRQQIVLKPEVAYILTDMLKSAITNGTGTSANIGRPAAGKTGTTDNYGTAWFIGYTPDLLTGIYVGNDDRAPINIAGSGVASMWGNMMRKVVQNTPESDFPVPTNVVTNIPIFTDSGKYAYTTNGYSDIEYSAFVKGTEPKAAVAPPPKQPSVPAPKKPGSTPVPPPVPEKKPKPFWRFW
jgi:penicillin-binding protein 1A